MTSDLIICSDCQEGTGLAAIKTAYKLNVKTAGYMPLGFVNHSGEHPDYEGIYGVHQWGNTGGFKAAIRANVSTSHGTVIIWHKPETIAAEAVVEYNKPFIGVRLEREDDEEFRRHGKTIADFIAFTDGMKRVNVTGNSSQVHPTAFKSTCWIMKYALETLGYATQ